MREYKCPLERFPGDTVFTVEDWENNLKDVGFSNYNGSGYWCYYDEFLNGLFESNDEIFSTPRLNATHVSWYNK